MKKVLLLISLIISSIVSAQVLVIDGTHHLISENTFPLYLNAGTQLDFFTPPVSLISKPPYYAPLFTYCAPMHQIRTTMGRNG